MTLKILAVDDNPVNLKVISATLLHAGYEVITAASGNEALNQVETVAPNLIILDVDMPEMDGYEVSRRLRSKPATSNLPIMILTVHDTLEEKVKGFEAGADDYMTKPFQTAELLARIKVLLRRFTSDQEILKPQKGKVISMFSLRGGIGVSTIAANLSVAFSHLWAQPTALVDLALTMGHAALMMNLPLRNTWADLAKVPVNELEPDFIFNVLMKHESNVYILASPRSVGEGETVTGEVVGKTLGIIRTRFPYVIVDLPHDFSETTLITLDLSEDVVLVMSPELASVRSMVGCMELFRKLGYEASKLHLVLNWTFERKGLPRKEIEKVLNHPFELVIPFASETFVSAINLGIPVAYNQPNSPIGILFDDFAYSLSNIDDQKKPISNPSPALVRARQHWQDRQSSNR